MPSRPSSAKRSFRFARSARRDELKPPCRTSLQRSRSTASPSRSTAPPSTTGWCKTMAKRVLDELKTIDSSKERAETKALKDRLRTLETENARQQESIERFRKANYRL